MTSERKVVVITGASRGIGAQLSKAYRHIGYQVIANARSMRESEDPAILAIEGDISRPETAERILSIATERFGRIETLVNNAGIFIPKPFTEYSELGLCLSKSEGKTKSSLLKEKKIDE